MAETANSSLEPDSVELFVSGPPVIGQYDPAAEPLFGRNLRVALAMRGGISLAVWIGGAVGELDLLRRIRWVRDSNGAPHCHFLWPLGDTTESAIADATTIARAEVYASAIRSRGYDQVEFDVLAGASAGGLNSVLYSVAQRAGVKLDAILGTWVTFGAFMGLLQPNGWGGLNAPLNGDGRFAPGVLEALKDLQKPSQRPVSSHRAKHVVVDLSASVIDTEDALDRVSSGGRGEFHFVGSDPGLDQYGAQIAALKERGRGIPTPGNDADLEQNLARLAYSARSTSSLPGGFEPALIHSSWDANAGTSNPDEIDYSFAFHLQRKDFTSPYRIIDGGVTDNMPIDRAFLAIRGIPSDVYSDRAIIYLDPAPPAQPLIRTPSTFEGTGASPALPFKTYSRPDRSSLILKAVARLFALRGTPESAEAKVEEVERYRRSLHLGAARENSLGALSGTVTPPQLSNLLQRYATYRMEADLDFISEVFGDPAVWQLGTDLPVRHAFAQPDQPKLELLESRMRVAYESLGVQPIDLGNAVYRGPGAVIDCCRSLLVWIRALEDANFVAYGSTRLNVTNNAVVTLRQRVYDSLDAATRLRDLQTLVVCMEALEYDEITIDPEPTPLEFANTVATRLTFAPPPVLADILTKLDDVVDALAKITSVSKLLPDSVWSGFPSQPGRKAIEVAAFSAAAGIPDPLNDLLYWEISASARVSNPDDFPKLLDEQFRLTLKSTLSLAGQGIVPGSELTKLLSSSSLTANSKLKGSALGAFAGFLSADWRRNDWLWGRLDAASSVLDFLVSIPVPTAATVSDYFSAQDDSAWVGSAQDQILLEAFHSQRSASVSGASAATSDNPGYRSAEAPLDPLPNSDEPTIPDLRRSVVMGADSIASLRPGYRVGVATKVAHLGFRALGRRTASVWTVVVTFLLQPLVGVIATVVDPPRLFLVGVLLAGVWTIGDISFVGANWLYQPEPHSHGLGGWLVLAVLVVVAVLAYVSGLRGRTSARKRWADVIGALPVPPVPPVDPTMSPTALAQTLRDRAGIRGAWMLAGGALIMLVAIVANAFGVLPWPSTILGVGTGVALAIASGRRRTYIPGANGYAGRDHATFVLAGLLYAGILAYPAIISSNLSPALTQWAGQLNLCWPVGIATFFISIACNAGWRGGWIVRGQVGKSIGATVWWIVQAAIAGGLGGLVAFVLTLPSLGTHSHALDALFVVAALFVAGTAQWYLVRWGRLDPADVPRR